jgi:hypothetical protein
LAAFRVEFNAPCAVRWKYEIRHGDSPVVGENLDRTSVHENVQSKFASVKMERRGGSDREILTETGVAGMCAVDEELLFFAIEPN